MNVDEAAIIIPNYNGEQFIMDTIHLLTAGISNVKIFVVDDASTDNSVKLLQAAGIQVIQRPINCGFAAAVNTGLKYVQSFGFRYALVCNSDLIPDYKECHGILNSFFTYFKDPLAGVIGFLEKGAYHPQHQEQSDISGFLFWIKLELLEVTGFFDERFYMYGEETDFFRRVVANGYKIVQSGIQVSHATEKSGVSKLKNSWYAIRNCLFLEVKNGNFIAFLKKTIALFCIIFGMLGDKNDPSTKRVRRPGYVIGPLMLIAAFFWNLYHVLEMAMNKGKR